MSPWVVPGFAEERQLGRGATGRVVAAVHEASGTRVAIKYLAPALFRDPDFLAGFRAEADLLRSLDVPQVVRLLDYVEEPGQGAAIVMELVDGVSLHEMISRRGATSAESALVVLKGSLLGLAAAHALGIVHRDYKPENVLIDREGNSKLSDFGVAVKAGRRVPSAGTPLYMAPEQWEGAPPSPAADIYAAAAVFFECLTSKTPFSGRLGQLRRQHASAAVPLELIDEPLRSLIARGMAKNPAERPPTAMAFVAELESTAAAAYGPDWEERGRSQLKERAAALLLLLLGTAAVGGGIGDAAASTWLAAHRTAVFATAAVAIAALVTVAVTRGGGSPSPKPSQAAATSPAHGGSATPPTHTLATFGATVTANPPVAISACATPTTFTYSADLTATAAGTVSYKWVYSTGKSGPVQTATFTAPGTQKISGGAVQTKTASTGWAAIQMVSPSTVLSNKATYQLTCTVPTGTTGLSAHVTPATQTVTCGSAPPSFTFTGLISSPKAETITYHWALSDGATSPSATLTFTGPDTQAVQALTVTPPADTASGSGMLVITNPGMATSSPVYYSLTCTKTGPPPPPPPLTLSAAAHANPATETVACSAAPPTFTFSGTITANQATTVSYHWKLPSGNGPNQTLHFTKAGTLAVTSAAFTPATDTASGSGTIVITNPMAATSAAAGFRLTCTPANVSVSLTSSPASPDSVTCSAAPPTFTLTGSILSDQPLSVTYHWARSDGTTTSPATVRLKAGTASDVTDLFTPPFDSFSGSDSLDITTPVHISQTLPIDLTCTYPAISISGTIPSGTVGTPYAGANVSATGGKPPYAWTANGLPTGLAMSSDGTIRGTPTASGTFTAIVTASDSQSLAGTASKQFTVVINPAPVNVMVQSLGSTPPSPVITKCGDGQAFTVTADLITASGSATATYHWSRSDGTSTTPAPVSVSPAGVAVTDQVTSAGTSWKLSDTIEVTAPNVTSQSISLSYSCSYPKLSIRASELPSAEVGTSYSEVFAATGGDDHYTWSASGLPPGLTLSSAGTISGTPTTGGKYPVSLTVTDGESPTPQTATSTVTIMVNWPQLSITGPASIDPCAYLGNNPGCPPAQFTASGGDGITSHYTWSATGLPGGVTVSSTGQFGGIPTEYSDQAYPVTVTVTDSYTGQSASMKYQLTVNNDGLTGPG
jgi:serine/threonine-protein kinase